MNLSLNNCLFFCVFSALLAGCLNNQEPSIVGQVSMPTSQTTASSSISNHRRYKIPLPIAISGGVLGGPLLVAGLYQGGKRAYAHFSIANASVGSNTGSSAGTNIGTSGGTGSNSSSSSVNNNNPPLIWPQVATGTFVEISKEEVKKQIREAPDVLGEPIIYECLESKGKRAQFTNKKAYDDLDLLLTMFILCTDDGMEKVEIIEQHDRQLYFFKDDTGSDVLHEIIPGIDITSASGAIPSYDPMDDRDQPTHGLIISLHKKWPSKNPNVQIEHIQVDDDGSRQSWEIIKSKLPLLFLKIDATLQKNQKVLVHCQAGISRSATVVIAYLMNRYGTGFRETFNFVRTKRPIANPNIFNFQPGLIQYEQELRSTH